jgi:DNA-directed RNA polymerase subunit omega
MARVTVEDCLKNVESRFALVHLAVRRVLQLRHGVPALQENTRGNKEVVLALREIASRKITVDNIREMEDNRPLQPPVPQPETMISTQDLKEILDEETSYNPSIEFAESDQFTEEEIEGRGVAKEEEE